MIDKERRNAYHRQYYELNLEKMRQRSRDKYHRLKGNWKANLTPEKKAERHRKNYESQVKFIEKTTGRKVISHAERRKKIAVKEKIIKTPKLKPKIEKPFKANLKQEKIKPIRTLKQVLNVLKKDLKSNLWSKSFLLWTDKNWEDFIKLENLTE